MGIYITDNGKEKICCACKDLREQGEQLIQASTIELSSMDSVSTKKITIESIYEFSKNVEGLTSEEMLEFYFKQFVVDAFIGNTDRHNGNWGIITDDLNSYVKIAPTFDCGSSFSSLLDEIFLNENTARDQALNTASTLSMESDSNLIVYSQYIRSMQNEYVNKALLEIVPKIDLNDIFCMIDDIECISDKRKDFYKKTLKISYDEVLIDTFKKIKLQKVEQSDYDFAGIVNFKDVFEHEMKPLLELPLYQATEVDLCNELITIRRVSNKDFVVLGLNDLEHNYFRVDSSFKYVNYFCKNLSYIHEDLYCEI